jgi:hypothetical protein
MWHAAPTGFDSYLEANVINDMVLPSGVLEPGSLVVSRNLGGRRPQAFWVSTGRNCRSCWQVARRHAHANPSWDVVAHSPDAFMHLAIHKAARVACRPLPTGALSPEVKARLAR